MWSTISFLVPCLFLNWSRVNFLKCPTFPFWFWKFLKFFFIRTVTDRWYNNSSKNKKIQEFMSILKSKNGQNRGFFIIREYLSPWVAKAIGHFIVDRTVFKLITSVHISAKMHIVGVSLITISFEFTTAISSKIVSRSTLPVHYLVKISQHSNENPDICWHIVR